MVEKMATDATAWKTMGNQGAASTLSCRWLTWDKKLAKHGSQVGGRRMAKMAGGGLGGGCALFQPRHSRHSHEEIP